MPWPFCSVLDPTPYHQGPHLKGVLIPAWGLVLTAHRNAEVNHVKIFGEWFYSGLLSRLDACKAACTFLFG